MTANPGWYPDPAGSLQERWWDGTAWTEHVQPAPPPPAVTPAPPSPMAPPFSVTRTPAQSAQRTRRRVPLWGWIIIGIAGFFTALFLLGVVLSVTSGVGGAVQDQANAAALEATANSVANTLTMESINSGVTLAPGSQLSDAVMADLAGVLGDKYQLSGIDQGGVVASTMLTITSAQGGTCTIDLVIGGTAGVTCQASSGVDAPRG